MLNAELLDKCQDAIDDQDGDCADYKKAVESAAKHRPPDPGVPARKAKVIDWVGDDPSVEWARELLPQVKGCSISKDTTFHHRWKIAYPGETQSVFTKSWTTEASPLRVLKDLLKTVWTEHLLLHVADHCWFDIDQLPKIAEL